MHTFRAIASRRETLAIWLTSAGLHIRARGTGLAVAASFMLFLIPAAAHAQSKGATARADSAPILKRVIRTEQQFLAQWRAAWEASMDEARPKGANYLLPLLPDTGAAYRADSTFSRAMLLRFFPMLCIQFREDVGRPTIPSAGTVRGVCPIWIPRGAGPTPDLSAIRDSAISPSRRPAVLAARERLLALLDSAGTMLPTDPFIVGQRVRFALDQNAPDQALATARSCVGNRWWCSALTGLALHRRHEELAADSAFAVAAQATAGEARCEWTDIELLLDSASAVAYHRLPCVTRDSLMSRFWWLTDAMWSEPANDRRVEHYARATMLRLRSALDQDELYHWRFNAGGDAVAKLIVRYGWPSYVYWRGSAYDARIDPLFLGPNFATKSFNRKVDADTAPPYTTAEYSNANRVHLAPSWNVILDPVNLLSREWQNLAPSWSTTLDPANLLRRDSQNVAQHYGTGTWWFAAAEHYLPNKPLTLLNEDQAVLLRRETTSVLAYATDLARIDLGRTPGDSIDAVLYRSPGPDTIVRVAERRSPATGTLRMRVEIPAVATVIGVEIQRDSGHARAGRGRFGVHPPPTLESMHPTERAVSDPVLLRAPSDENDILPDATDDALGLMLGSTLLNHVNRIGVYWETYGFAATDTVEIALWIERHTPQGIVMDFTNALHLTTNPNTPVAISWRETQSERTGRVLAGHVPVFSRSKVVDISKLSPGDYWIDIAVGTPGQVPVRGRQAFVVR